MFFLIAIVNHVPNKDCSYSRCAAVAAVSPEQITLENVKKQNERMQLS